MEKELLYCPKVSIVIPAFNASNYLAEAIESALNQSYKNIEIIVVNDGSKDGGKTREVAERYDDKIRYYEKENGGSSSALNFGIQKMSGEWFSWLSHDDLYYPNKVLEQIKYINEHLNNYDDENLSYNVFFAAANLIDASGKIISKTSKKKLKLTNKKINKEKSYLHLIAEPIQDGFHGCSCLVHKKAFERLGMFDENLRLLNDMDMWFRLYANCYSIHFIPKVLVKGRVHSKQVSRSIGFSYHNPEQDMFWARSLQWLKDNCLKEFKLFYIFGKTAYLKTRYKEADEAFKIARNIDKGKTIILFICKMFFVFRSKIKELLKKIYFKIKL